MYTPSALYGELPELFLKIDFDGWPLQVDDAESDTVPFSPVRHDPFMANNPFLGSAETKDGCPRANIQLIRCELHTDAIKDLEGVSKHEELGFSIHEAPLMGSGKPRVPDLHLSILPVDSPKTGTPNDFVAEHRDIGNNRTIATTGERLSDVVVDGLSVWDNGDLEVP